MREKKTRILLVEDQKFTLQLLEFALNRAAPKYIPGYTKGDYEVSRCYADAQDKVMAQEYDIVIIDHKMPFRDQGDLEMTDFSRFCASVEDMGYRLIPQIRTRSPNAAIIRTSSSSKSELRGFPSPDYTLRKTWDDAQIDLEKILCQAGYGSREDTLE